MPIKYFFYDSLFYKYNFNQQTKRFPNTIFIIVITKFLFIVIKMNF